MKHLLRLIIALGGLMLLTACGASDKIDVRSATASPANAQGESIVLLILENQSSEADYLTAVETSVAAQAALMMSLTVDREEEDIEIVQPVPEMEILPKAAFEMSPHGIFIQLSGLKQALRAGDTFDITLHFKRAGKITIPVTVK